MKIRSGFVSNSSSSSFILECKSSPELILGNKELIKEELINIDNMPYIWVDKLINVISQDAVAYPDLPECYNMWEVQQVMDEYLTENEWIELYKSDMSIKDFIKKKFEGKNFIAFNYSSDDEHDNPEAFEYYPKLYLKCPFKKVSHH